MAKILAIKARQILDSRGNPTIECELKVGSGKVIASVPSGASKGKNEALELRDGGKAYMGLGVEKAVKNINNKIAKKIIGKNPENQQQIDEIMLKLDATKNKTKLGANAILAVSIATAKAGAQAKGIPLYEHIAEIYGNKKPSLPVPSFNIINGGKHAGNNLEIQEYMIQPTGARRFSEALQIGSEIYHTLKKILQDKYSKQAVNVGDEGGFAPPMNNIEEPLTLIQEATAERGYTKKIKLAIDAAATTFWRNRNYYLDGEEYTPAELAAKYEELVKKHPLISIEDPFQEEDFTNFAKLTKKLKKTQIVGDDLLVTNPYRVQKAIVQKSCNCLLLKINQIGTLTEALEAARIAKTAKWNIMVSHRSGETNDNFIADLAVGIGAQEIKAGAPCRGERLSKYNQLLRIEEELGKKAKYIGKYRIE
ncbi:phosphopyruvate hydratase [Candidatus Woesearchaeota archaeon]|nr:MAG: phosphopyruvate hydratase [Candidatus Woesearchaeota archaeon ex4484_78]RLE45241.1 MAG: phosphopyruvate hydratase [Candidatus Woesearchaeota archaeon]